MSNPDLIKQFLTLYQTQLPIDFNALKEAVIDGNYTNIANKAHHIKPTMVYIGANEQQNKLQNIEVLAKLKNTPEINRLFKELEQDFNLLLEEMSLYVRHL